MFHQIPLTFCGKKRNYYDWGFTILNPVINMRKKNVEPFEEGMNNGTSSR